MLYDPENRLPTIYGYAEPFELTGDVIAVAIAEDGTQLSTHLSSHEGWAAEDLGMNGVWKQHKHEEYAAHYPHGYKTEFVPSHEVERHAGLQTALQKYSAAHADATIAEVLP